MHYQNKNWSKHGVEHTLETPLPEQAELSSTPLTGLHTHPKEVDDSEKEPL
jgi:hypothetical protein